MLGEGGERSLDGGGGGGGGGGLEGRMRLAYRWAT